MKKLLALALAGTMTLSLAACGGSKADTTTTDTAAAEETTETADTADAASTDGQTYTVGICQLVQHEALDAATQGFKDAIVEALGEDNVTFEEQNASGDSATCATIINQFVSDNVDLILANATPPCRRQHREPIPSRYWEPLLPSMA